MDPITIILGIFALIGSIAFAARDRQDQKKANQEVMDFNAEEAEKSRDWQEEQYKKYESVAAQMQQRQQAGLNPNEGISSMSVGSGSTASTSANQISPLSKTDFSLFSQIPGMSTQVQQTKLQNKLLGEQTLGVKLDNEAKRMQNAKLAIETNDYPSYYSLMKEGLVKGNQLTDEQIKKAFDEARMAHVKANEAEDAYNAGVNQIVDGHNLTEAQLQYYMKQKEEIDARIRNLNLDADAKQFALNLSKIYDEQFLKLDLAARETEVKEFLDTSEVRVSLYNVQKSFAKLAVDEATRQDALAKIKSEYELHIAQQILNAAEDGETSFDAVVLKYFCENPGSTLSALASLGASFRPNISNSSTTRYDTGAHFTTINN